MGETMPKSAIGLTREKLKEFVKNAHEECKKKVGLSRHVIGGTAGGVTRRQVIRRNRNEYLKCIKESIERQVNDYAKTMGLTIK